MNDDLKMARVRDCKVCCVPHSEDIHDATLRIRHWLRQELARKLGEALESEEEAQDPALVA